MCFGNVMASVGNRHNGHCEHCFKDCESVSYTATTTVENTPTDVMPGGNVET